MADTNHSHASIPVEGDGVSYSGIVWFVVILAATALFCEVFVWGLFHVATSQHAKSEPARAPLAVAASQPTIDGGRLVASPKQDEHGELVKENGRLVDANRPASQPGLLVEEPQELKAFRTAEDRILNEYQWIDQASGKVRLPIDRAKDVLLSKGLPVRAEAPASGQ